jgi:GntR family transcriptional regulator, transcriptional repressor for pyruvate dehydrogenase complex
MAESPRAARSAAFLRPINARRAFEEILDQLEEAITSGHLASGDRLPSERDLATQFGVSRTSVREALRVLEALGLVRVRRGSDNGAVLLAEPADAFTHLLRFLLALRHISPEDLLDAFATIEAEAAERAARARPKVLLRELASYVKEMEQPDLNRDDFLRLDSAFHLKLTTSMENALFSLFLEGIRLGIQQLNLQDDEDWRMMRESLISEHQVILEAIVSGDAPLASERMSQHIEKWGGRAIELSKR